MKVQKYFQIFNIKMEIFEQLLQPRSLDHDQRVHVQQTHTGEVSKDPSCVLCNMVRTTPKIDFWNFWKWYRKVTGAETYTENTIKVFYKKEIKTEWDNMEEVTAKAISLIETMRYHPKNGIEIKTQDLVRRLTLVIIQSDWFKGKIEEENEEMSDLSEDDIISIASTVSSIAENEDGIGESEEFKRFWELFKKLEPRVRSFNKNAIDGFEKLIMTKDEVLENLAAQEEEEVNKLTENFRQLITGLRYKGLRPLARSILPHIIDLTILSKKFTLTIEETEGNLEWNKTEDLQKENEGLRPIEKFWLWYQELIPEAKSYGEKTINAFNKLTQLEYTNRSWEVKQCLKDLILGIEHNIDENHSPNLEGIYEEIITVLSASKGFSMSLKDSRREYRKITEGKSNVTSEEISPKEKSPEKSDSEENNETKKKDKGKERNLYFSCPGNNCNGYQQDEKGLKCIRCDKKMRFGENLKKHCDECHLGNKKEEIIDKCERCDKSWKDCTCQCREHGDVINCGIGGNDECYYITKEEYDMYQSKSKVFQLLVKAGTYKWNGETYETISTIDEVENDKEREENIGSEKEDTKPTKKRNFGAMNMRKQEPVINMKM